MLQNINILLSYFNNLECYLFTTIDGNNGKWDFYFKNKKFLIGQHKNNDYKEFNLQEVSDFLFSENINLEIFEKILLDSFLIKHYHWTINNQNQFLYCLSKKKLLINLF